MNGAGNDFILLDAIAEPFDEAAAPALARALCDRRRSIGADGLMLVTRAEGDADYRMRFYNSDGSLGEMCGNGARCICRYGFEHGYELGDPGIPHLAVQTPDLAGQDEAALRQLGRKLRYHPALPKGANVNFYELTGPDTVLEKTYERGVEDFTLACGTGTGAVVTVLTLLGKVSGRNVRVRMDGGELAVDAEAHDGRIENLYLTGPAALVCAGKILDKTILDLIKKQEEKA